MSVVTPLEPRCELPVPAAGDGADDAVVAVRDPEVEVPPRGRNSGPANAVPRIAASVDRMRR